VNRRHRQRGASIVHVMVALIPMLAFGAFAIDLNNVFVSHAELQAAADAGALEGARLLYNTDLSINTNVGLNNASDPARNAAMANLSRGTPVEVVAVERGHWEFGPNALHTADPVLAGILRGGWFAVNDTTSPAELVDEDGAYRTFQDLNTDPDEINAVLVTVARDTTPVQAIFARLLGIDDFTATAASVAYVGFAGRIGPGEVDFPIAMCEEVLTLGCDVARLIPTGDQTGGWTNFNQPEVANPDATCTGATNANELVDLIDAGCPAGGVNPHEIVLGIDMQVNNGQVNSAFDAMYDCWKAMAPKGEEWPVEPVRWRLPVVAGCRFGGSCAPVIGAVEVTVLWMVLNQNKKAGKMDKLAPVRMGDGADGIADWDGGDLTDPNEGVERWNDFVTHFNITTDGSTLATWESGGYAQKTVYFEPSCEPLQLGGTGGANYGVRAAVPVLVF
jgi:hypothetical protein